MARLTRERVQSGYMAASRERDADYERGQRAVKIGKMVGKWRPSGRRVAPNSKELNDWQELQLSVLLDTERLAAEWSLANEARLDVLRAADRRADAARYRRAYGSGR